MTKKSDLKRQVSEAISACKDKKAEDITVMELEQGSGAFTDYFVVCSGTNPRQIQAIADEVEDRLEKKGMRPAHTEGYKQAEWGVARLRRLRGTRFFGEGPQVLRSRAPMEVCQEARALRNETCSSQEKVGHSWRGAEARVVSVVSIGR